MYYVLLAQEGRTGKQKNKRIVWVKLSVRSTVFCLDGLMSTLGFHASQAVKAPWQLTADPR